MEMRRLAAITIFADLPERELMALAAVATEVELAEGSPLTVEGEFGHSVLAIEEGTADVICDGAKRATVGPGAVVGEVAVLSSGRRTASVVATSPVRLISLFKRDVWALERDAPEAVRRLRELIGPRIAAAAENER